MAEPFYTCCEDGMLSQVPPTDSSGLCPACKPATAPQPLLTDDDWQAIADHPRNPLAFIPGRLKALVEERIAIARARGVMGRVTITPEGEATVPGVGVEFAMQCLARADALLQGIADQDVTVNSAAHELHHALKVLRRALGVPACSRCGKDSTTGRHGEGLCVAAGIVLPPPYAVAVPVRFFRWEVAQAYTGTIYRVKDERGDWVADFAEKDQAERFCHTPGVGASDGKVDCTQSPMGEGGGVEERNG